jgi:hypothetical protein
MIGRPSRARLILVYATMPLVLLPALAILLTRITRTSLGTTPIGVIAIVGLIAAVVLLLNGFLRAIELTRALQSLMAKVQALEADLAHQRDVQAELVPRQPSIDG